MMSRWVLFHIEIVLGMLISVFVFSAACALPARQMENLGRGVVAIKQSDGKVFVGWRMLGVDPDSIAFNVYRSTGGSAPVKLNARPITGATQFVDGTAKPEHTNAYFVRPVLNGRELTASRSFRLPPHAPARPYLSIPLQTPVGYAPNDASVGDLDGDGEYEIVLHQAGRGKDNSQNGETDPPLLQAYKLDGTLLWTINLGRNIREGAHYTQFMVYDLDGDGRAEIVCKTADGTTDGRGKMIGDAKADWRNPAGRILAGPEFLTVFDGQTGAALATTAYIPARHPTERDPTSDQLKAVWGDGYGNRPDRFLACIAYLDGVHPSVVMCRGYYTRTVLAAWDWQNGKLTSRWVFDTDQGHPTYAGQGNHNLSVADVDGDGKDEIVYGKMCVDDKGQGLYTTGIGHGDAMHLTDIDPSRPGLEVFSIQERYSDAGLNLFDARTGAILWKKPPLKAGSDGEGPARGLALDIDPRYPGFECWGAGAGMFGKLFDCKGNQIANASPSVNMGVYWDGDLLSEVLDGTHIGKWDYLVSKTKPLLNAEDYDCVANNGTKANPCLSADILGDWREEVIWRTSDNKELRIFTTTIPTQYRFRTFMHDPEYRLSIAWQNVGYNQPPHTDFLYRAGYENPASPQHYAGDAEEDKEMTTEQPEYLTNPVVPQRADPWCLKHTDGTYYFTGSVPAYDRIELLKAASLQGLAFAEPKIVWRRHETGPMGRHIWAPELHFIDGRWYLYFAAGHAESPWEIRMYVLENESTDPTMGVWTEKGQIQTRWESFSLDATTFARNGVRYLVWAQNDPSSAGGTNLYIAPLADPWTLAGPQVLLTRPEFPWEREGYLVNEGPAVLQRNGKIFLTYSASATDARYCMGLLTAADTSDLLDPQSWTKSPLPVFASSDANRQFGPGHNSFTKSADGSVDVLVYHARSYPEIHGNSLYDPNRHARMQSIAWAEDGSPMFGLPVPDGPHPLRADLSCRE